MEHEPAKKKKLKLISAEEELDREFEQPMLPPKKTKTAKSLTYPPPTPFNESRENPLTLKELPSSAAAVASAIEETSPQYVYPLGERGDRQLMLFDNGVLLFSKSDTLKFVELDLNR